MLSQYTIDEVENLIKKHEAFEKAAAAQEERFAALERLTTVGEIMFSFVYLQVDLGEGKLAISHHFQFELKEIKRRQEEEERLLHREHARPLDRPDAGAQPRSETGSIKSGSECHMPGMDFCFFFPLPS